MYKTVRYVGMGRRTITWNSMGKCYSYTLSPGDTVDILSSQVKNAKAVAMFEDVSDKRHKRTKKIRRIIEGESSEVVTESDENVFEKQDRLDPFTNVERSGTEVEIKIDDEDENEELMVEEVVKESVVIEEEPEVETEGCEEEEDKVATDTDFATLNKKQLAAFLILYSPELKEYVLLKERKDTLIKMCVDVEASL